MMLQHPAEMLDRIEKAFNKELAERGVRLERKWVEWPTPPGWTYMSWAVSGGDGPFTLKILLRWTRTRKKPVRETSEEEWSYLRQVMLSIWAAREALSERNAVAALGIGISLQTCIHRLDMPLILAAGVSRAQAEKAKHERRPRLTTRAVMLAVRQGYATTADVEKFLFNNSELSDEFGDLGIESNGDGFIITDYSSKEPFVTAPLKKARIAQKLAEMKNSC
jgi:hypothetical protein